MSADRLFGTKELVKALTKLDFEPKKQVGSSHNKWASKIKKQNIKGKRPFITVIQGKKQYAKKTCNGYLKQLMCLGYDLSEIQDAFAK